MNSHEEDQARSLQLWNQTRSGPFRSRAKINGLRRTYGEQPMTLEEYRKARDAYYMAHPTAWPQDNTEDAER